MPNRTGFVDNPAGIEFSAQKHFPILINTFDEIDLIILGLGTNDFQFLFDFDVNNLEKGLINLINIAI